MKLMSPLINTFLVTNKRYFVKFMSLFAMPIHIANQLEKLHRHYLWDSAGAVPKSHLVDWGWCVVL